MPHLLEDFQPAVIGMILDRLTPDNILLTIGHRNVVGDRTESWYKVSYKVTPIDPKVLSEWKATLESNSNASTKVALKLPERNEYLPDKRLLNELPASTNITGLPKLMLNETNARTWCMNSHPFENPKVDIDILLLYPPDFYQNRRDNLLAALFSKLL